MTKKFLLHFAEMLIAMFAGMLLLGPVADWLFGDQHAHADVASLIMATNMTIGMSAWMALRRHGVAEIAEMGAAMYLPFVIFFVPYWTGAVSGHFVMMAGHVLMVPAMFLLMLRRRHCYA